MQWFALSFPIHALQTILLTKIGFVANKMLDRSQHFIMNRHAPGTSGGGNGVVIQQLPFNSH